MHSNQFEIAKTLRQAAAATGGAIATSGTTSIAAGAVTEGVSGDGALEILFLITLAAGDNAGLGSIEWCPDNLWDADYTENLASPMNGSFRFCTWSNWEVAPSQRSPQGFYRYNNATTSRVATVRVIRRVGG